MRNIYHLAPILLCFCSCATYMNSDKTLIVIGTDRHAKVEVQSQVVYTSKNSVSVLVRRSSDPLQIKISSDSIQKIITVKPLNSFLFWANIPCNYGIGIFVDRHHAKRYTYPREIYSSLADSSTTYKRSVPYNAGKNFLSISVPHVNSFLVRPDIVTKSRTNTGFFGAGLSFDHYYHPNKFLRVSIGAVTNFPIPIIAPFDYKGDMETMSSEYLNISNNYQLNRFLLGYGISIARNSWRHTNNFTIPVINYGSQNDAAMGIVLQSYYRFGRSFYLGAIYRPTFLRFPSSHTLQYEHLISIDLNWRIRL